MVHTIENGWSPMKDGYYVSSYLSPPGLCRVIGGWQRHDGNISLWRKDGSEVRLLKHVELERLTGLKHDGTPTLTADGSAKLIESVISEFGISLEEMVEFWGTPGIGKDHVTAPFRRLPAAGIARHSIAHLLSGVLMDTAQFYNETIIGMALDAGPDNVNESGEPRHLYAGGVVRRGVLEVFPVESPGALWEHAATLFGLAEGSLMALASASRAACTFDIPATIRNIYFGDASVFHIAEDIIQTILRHVRRVGITDDMRFSPSENEISAVMKIVQEMSYQVVERNVARVLTTYSLDPTTCWMSMTGGYALNCPNNTRLLDSFHFKGLLSPPVVNDSGQSIGMALEQFYVGLGPQRMSFRYPSPYLGGTDDGLDELLASHSNYIADVSLFSESAAVSDVANEPIAWFDGRAECGPRALGNRSIIGDPRSDLVKSRLNDIKGRQWWRPVAPVILESKVETWFEQGRRSPYMLEAFRVREDRRPAVPGIAHLDGTARVQTLAQEQNPRLYALLAAFDRTFDIPMLCNTSLNDRGEPIIDTIQEAFNFCLRKRIRVGYFNGKRVLFTNHQQYADRAPALRRRNYFEATREALIDAHRRMNPAGLTDVEVYLYLQSGALRRAYDISDEVSGAKLKLFLGRYLAKAPAVAETAARNLDANRKQYRTQALAYIGESESRSTDPP